MPSLIALFLNLRQIGILKMDLGKENPLCSQENLPTDWGEMERERPSDSEETGIFETDDDTKIKPEIELKEETEGFVYKADFRGHLQLVNLDHDVHNHHGTIENNQPGEEPAYSTDYKQESLNGNAKINTERMHSSFPVQEVQAEWSMSEDGQQITVAWKEESESPERIHVYRHLKNLANECMENNYYVKEEPSDSNSRENIYEHSLPEIYDYSSDNTWEPQSENSSQVPSLSSNLNGKSALLTQAEKKRLYRLRIKEENPSMWSTIKKREAARKREQRERRRQLLYQMQKAMELSIASSTPDAVNYLEALKERYPELWNQLVNALPATQIRNEQLYNERNMKSRRHSPKPAKMYKDVIEAQKKRLYRQRIKEERPEMYERQKARDAYARSIQRLVLKKKQSLDQNRFNLESLHPNEVEKKLTYLHNLQVETYQFMSSKRYDLDLSKGMNGPNSISGENSTHAVNELPSAVTPAEPPYHNPNNSKSDPSQVCDNKHSGNGCNDAKPHKHSSDNCISNKTKESIKVSGDAFPVPAACSTQSDILWYWNDVKGSQYIEDAPPPYVPWRRGPHTLTEEERLQKILKERMQLREKRRRYRMNMTPEKRSEFLEIERERLKLYRMKKKAAAAATNEMLLVNQ